MTEHLESTDLWPAIEPWLDQLPLKQLSVRFDVEPGAIAGAIRRTGAARSGRVRLVRPKALRERGMETKMPTDNGKPDPRPGTRDIEILRYWDLLGKVPDGEIATKAGVSAGTIFNFRHRHDIDAYQRGDDDDGGMSKPAKAKAAKTTRKTQTRPSKSKKASKRRKRPGRPSKLEPYRDQLGKVPDQALADKVGLTLAAVRAYRRRHGIPAPSDDGVRAKAQNGSVKRSMPTKAAETYAWRVHFADNGTDVTRIVVAPNAVDAAARASAGGPGEVRAIERLEVVLG